MKKVSEAVCPLCECNPANLFRSLRPDPVIAPCDDCFQKTDEQWERQSLGSSRVDVNAIRKSFLRRVPLEYRESDVSRFPETWIEVKSFLPVRGKGLILIGKTGKCKTRMGVQLVLSLIESSQAKGDFVSAQAYAELARTRYAFATAVKDEKRLQEIKNSELLLFDDLGKQSNSPSVEDAIFGLIEHRTSNRLPTIVTTNSTGGDLEATLSKDRGSALVRRLREFHHTIVVK